MGISRLLRRAARRPQGGLPVVPPALPPLPLYVAEPRGDVLPLPPFSDSMNDLDEPAAPRQRPRPPSLHPGDWVAQAPVDRIWQPGAWRLHATPEQAGVTCAYPARIYEVADVDGLHWEATYGDWVLRYERAQVVAELPPWRAFGPGAEAAEGILEAVAALTRDQVRALPVAQALPKFEIPVAPLDLPASHPDHRRVSHAQFQAMQWTESRGWAIDPDAGGHYYRGCYFNYNLSDPHWLSAMGRAMNAIAVAAAPDAFDAPTRARVERQWADLLAGA